MNFEFPSQSSRSVVQIAELDFDSAVRKFAPKSKQRLPASFRPLPDSVIIGKGKMPAQASGNNRLRELVKCELQNYADANHKREKSFIVTNILHKIQNLCPVGAFVRFDGESWWEVSDRISRDKIACMFRDSLSSQYKSSNKNKVAKRRVQRALKRTAAIQQMKQHQIHQEQQQQVQQGRHNGQNLEQKVQQSQQMHHPNVAQSCLTQSKRTSLSDAHSLNSSNLKGGSSKERDSILILEGLDLMGGLLDSIDRSFFDSADFSSDNESAIISSDEDDSMLSFDGALS